jgi:hypothetical protein
MDQCKLSSSCTPSAMRTARMTSAPAMPQNSTRGCSAAGMPVSEKMRMKTNRLSTERDFSSR